MDILEAITSRGYTTPALLLFSLQRDQDLEALIEGVLVSREALRSTELTADNFSASTEAGMIRRLRVACHNECGQRGEAGQPMHSLALSPLLSAGTIIDRQAMNQQDIETAKAERDRFEQRYPGEVLTKKTSPGASYARKVAEMARVDRQWVYIPWKKIISLEQESEILAGMTPPRGGGQIGRAHV